MATKMSRRRNELEKELSPWEVSEEALLDYEMPTRQYHDGVMLDIDDFEYPDIREAFGY